MARVQISDVLLDREASGANQLFKVGRTIPAGTGLTVTIREAADPIDDLLGAAATHYTAATGGSSSTSPITASSSTGAWSTWVDPGPYDVTYSGTGITTSTRRLEAVDAGVVTDITLGREYLSPVTSATFQAANDAQEASAGKVLLPPGAHTGLQNVVHRANVFIEGIHGDEGGVGTRLVGVSGQPILTLPDDNGSIPTHRGGLKDLAFSGGLDQVQMLNGVNRYSLEGHLLFDTPERYGLYGKGYIQHVEAPATFEFSGGERGMYVPGDVGVDGSASLFDKNNFGPVYGHGQSKNVLRIEPATGYNCTWDALKMALIGEDGAIIGGGIRGWTLKNVNTEQIGQADAGNAANTTGSITSGTAALTVASGTGYANGDAIVVAGAGSSAGADLVTTISSGGGTVNLVLAANASRTVSGAEVTKDRYSEVKLTTGAGWITFIDYIGGGAGVRYAVDCGAASYTVLFLNPDIEVRPVYDPDTKVTSIGGYLNARRKLDFSNENFQTTTFDRERSQIVSPPGGDVVLGFNDSNDNGTGTFGKLSFRKRDSNRTEVLAFDVDAGHLDLQPVGCHVRRTAVQAIPNSTFTEVTFTAERWDNGGFFAPSSTDIVVPSGRGGLYAIGFRWSWGTNSSGVRLVNILLDSGTDRCLADDRRSPSDVLYSAGSINVEDVLTDGDIITVVVYHEKGSDLDLGEASANGTLPELTLRRIGPAPA